MNNLLLTEFKSQFSSKEKKLLITFIVIFAILFVCTFSIVAALKAFQIKISVQVARAIYSSAAAGKVIELIAAVTGVVIPNWLANTILALGTVAA